MSHSRSNSGIPVDGTGTAVLTSSHASSVYKRPTAMSSRSSSNSLPQYDAENNNSEAKNHHDNIVNDVESQQLTPRTGNFTKFRAMSSYESSTTTTNNSSSSNNSNSTTTYQHANATVMTASFASTTPISSSPSSSPPLMTAASVSVAETSPAALSTSTTLSSSTSSSSTSFVLLLDKLIVLLALLSWYVISILCIVTTKIILQNWYVPPLILTIQQMIIGHGLLRFFIVYFYNNDRTIQPLPWDTTNCVTYTHHVNHTISGGNSPIESIHVNATTNHHHHNNNVMSGNNGHESSPRSSETAATSTSILEPSQQQLLLQQQQQQQLPLLNPNYQTKPELLLTDRIQRLLPWYHSKYSNFIWCGICNAGDFLASNIAFSCSSAHFVETIKASEPITTTTIAILWKVDKLSTMEGTSIMFLIFGVLLSTWGNSTTSSSNDTNTLPALDAMTVANHSTAMDEHKLMESIQTASLAVCANICFGFRAIHQKKYRSTTHDQLDDVNFLCRMMQVGATFLFIPTVLLYLPIFANALIYTPSAIQFTYLGLAFVNASAYVTYK